MPLGNYEGMTGDDVYSEGVCLIESSLTSSARGRHWYWSWSDCVELVLSRWRFGQILLTSFESGGGHPPTWILF
jgi:hypothetical protein